MKYIAVKILHSKMKSEINCNIFNDSLNKHCGTVLENIKHVLIAFKKRNKVLLNNLKNTSQVKINSNFCEHVRPIWTKYQHNENRGL